MIRNYLNRAIERKYLGELYNEFSLIRPLPAERRDRKRNGKGEELRRIIFWNKQIWSHLAFP